MRAIAILVCVMIATGALAEYDSKNTFERKARTAGVEYQVDDVAVGGWTLASGMVSRGDVSAEFSLPLADAIQCDKDARIWTRFILNHLRGAQQPRRRCSRSITEPAGGVQLSFSVGASAALTVTWDKDTGVVTYGARPAGAMRLSEWELYREMVRDFLASVEDFPQ